MGFKDFLFAQLERPSGLVGRFVMGRLLDKANARINEQALEVLGIEQGDRVLDVGFGGGAALARAASRVGKGQAVGVDLSRPMVRRARRKLGSLIEEGRVDVYEGDIHRLPFEDDAFDRAYTVNTVYFWAEPVEALREVRRVLKTGGRFVMALRSQAVMERHDFARGPFTLYTPDEARALVEEAGFPEVRVEHRDREEKMDSVLVVAEA